MGLSSNRFRISDFQSEDENSNFSSPTNIIGDTIRESSNGRMEGLEPSHVRSSRASRSIISLMMSFTLP